LDLGFFSVVQSLQHKKTPKTIHELVQTAKKSFEIFEVDTAKKIFLTLQTCMVEIMKIKGSIKYDIPHIQKDVLQREGQLATQIKCDLSLVEEVRHYLNMLLI
jgi:hypothetical protein